MNYTYKTKGTCSRSILIELDGDIVKNVVFQGGCNGNLQGISKLVTGKKALEVAELLKGVDCNGRGTSCPDQLSKAIYEAVGRK